MHRSTRLLLGAAPLLTALLLVTTSARLGQADEQDSQAQSKQVWLGNCAKCHAAPDAKFETDRAFLAQITETS